jgi:hypothetical protein
MFERLSTVLEEQVVSPIINYIVSSTHSNIPGMMRAQELGLPITRARKVVEAYMHPLFLKGKLDDTQLALYEQSIGKVKELLDCYSIVIHKELSS